MMKPNEKIGGIRPVSSPEAVGSAEDLELTSIELPETSQLRYRELLREVFVGIRSFDGTEQSFESLFSRLIALEECMANLLPSGESLTDSTEELISQQVGRILKSPVSISSLLDRAQRRFERSLSSSAGESTEDLLERIESQGILIHREAQVFVQTDGGEILTGPGNGSFEERLFQPRLAELIAGLSHYGVFKEDLIVRVGEVAPNMVRREPYIVVEIPKLGKEVVLCNQVGEVTFVSNRVFGEYFYASHSKDELKETEGIQSVVYRNKSQWLEGLGAHLTGELKDESGKVNVKELEEARQAVIASKSADEWSAMTQSEKRAYQLPGSQMKLQALASLFGVQGRPTGSHKDHLRLGERIFGVGTVISSYLRIEEATKDEIAAIVRDDPNMTPEKWVSMSRDDRKSYTVPGGRTGLKWLASRLEVEGQPVNIYPDHLRLGEAVFGVGTVISEQLRIATAKPEELIAIIRDESSLTPEQWSGMSEQERSKYKEPVTGLSIPKLATRLGYEKRVGKLVNHLELGEIIFGSDTVIGKHLKVARATKEELAIIVREEPGMTPERWMRMTQAEKKEYRVPDSQIAIFSLASCFGVDGDPARKHRLHLEVGEEIFGSETCIGERLRVERASTEELASIIRDSPGMTNERWNAMSQDEKKAYRVPGSELGLKALAVRFGITQDPVYSKKAHSALSQLIFDS